MTLSIISRAAIGALGLVAGLGALGIAVSAPTLAAPASPVREEALWFWEWSDGSHARSRELAEIHYTTWSELPGLLVASAPTTRGKRVLLEVHLGGRWVIEDASTTGSDGRALLRINPYCSHGDWCDGRTDYRIVVDGVQAPLRVQFTPRQSTP